MPQPPNPSTDTQAQKPGALLGVRAQVFQNIGSDHAHLTTEALCHDVIMPSTVTEKCSFSSLLARRDSEGATAMVAPATCFVSHAWKYRFSDVVDCVQQYEALHPNTYFWFDLFANNQHEATAYQFEWWCSTFRDSIQSIGSVLLVMAPWHNPLPLTRAWCLWEIFSAIQASAQLSIIIPLSQREDFKARVSADREVVLRCVMAVDARQAQALKATDRENIFHAISSTVGFDVLNTRVRDGLRDGYLRACVAIAEDERVRGPADARTGLLFNQLGGILAAFGQPDAAIACFEKALAVYLAAGGPQQLDAAGTESNLGSAYRARGDYDAAIAHHSRALTTRVALLGENHPETATSYNNIGIAYQAKGDPTQARDCHSRALAICLAVLGEPHPDTASSLSNLGVTLLSLGDFEQAIGLHTRALSIRTATLGPQHPLTANCHSNLGQAYTARGDSASAVEHHAHALAALMAAMGTHANTARAHHSLGLAQQAAGDLAQARHHFAAAAHMAASVLPAGHSQRLVYESSLTQCPI